MFRSASIKSKSQESKLHTICELRTLALTRHSRRGIHNCNGLHSSYERVYTRTGFTVEEIWFLMSAGLPEEVWRKRTMLVTDRRQNCRSLAGELDPACPRAASAVLRVAILLVRVAAVFLAGARSTGHSS